MNHRRCWLNTADVHTHTHIYTHTHTHKHIYTHLHTHTDLHTHTHTHIHRRIHISTDAHTILNARTHTHTHRDSYISRERVSDQRVHLTQQTGLRQEASDTRILGLSDSGVYLRDCDLDWKNQVSLIHITSCYLEPSTHGQTDWGHAAGAPPLPGAPTANRRQHHSNDKY